MAKRLVVVPAVEGLHKPTDVLVMDSLGDMVAHLKSIKSDRRARDYVTEPADPWSGRAWDNAVSALATGDTANVAAAQTMEREVESLLDWSARKHVVINSVAGGGGLNTSAWLVGRPDIIRRRVRVESESAPLTVVVASNSAASVSSRALVRRGTAILALVRLLSATRPVTLWSVAASPVSGPHHTGMALRIDTAPLVLGQAAFVLSDPAFGRRLCFATRVTVNGDVTGSGNGFQPFSGDSEKAKRIGGHVMAGALGVPAADLLYIPRAAPGDDSGLTDNPVQWLKDTLALYGRGGDAADE